MGIFGAVVGAWLFSLLGLAAYGIVGSMLMSLVGALVFLALIGVVVRRAC
ncbi:MAG: GlsB/YeaQ/YmgE family stress response membrane protein [Candidatus Omnitrophota bacterium]|nr:GlsB/YeaQ/YmgE family stress response membrane protein [Candidatus Omnitrophota bacterium]